MISILKQMAFNKNKKKVEKSIIKLKVIIFFNESVYSFPLLNNKIRPFFQQKTFLSLRAYKKAKQKKTTLNKLMKSF